MRAKILALSGFAAGWFAWNGSAAALTPEQLAQLPAPASHAIDFGKEIKPILETSCIKCHGRGKAKGGLRMDSRETFMKGGDSGPAILLGNSAESRLISMVQGFDPDEIMPKKGSRLTPEQIGLLRAWIDQGLKWDKDVSFGRLPPANMKPRRPELPASAKLTHPIDRLLEPYLVSHKLPFSAPVNERVFARRAYLDIIGLLPPPEQLEAFVSERAAGKRERLIKTLLSDD